MKRSVWIRLLCTLTMAVVFAAGPAWAGGIMLYQFGSPDVGPRRPGMPPGPRMPPRCSRTPQGWAASKSPRSWAACRPCTAT